MRDEKVIKNGSNVDDVGLKNDKGNSSGGYVSLEVNKRTGGHTWVSATVPMQAVMPTIALPRAHPSLPLEAKRHNYGLQLKMVEAEEQNLSRALEEHYKHEDHVQSNQTINEGAVELYNNQN